MDIIDKMKIFKKVVETQSFTKAAKELGMSLSVVSREIDKLEQYTTHQLLVRTTRTMSLTEVGKEYYQRVIRLLAETDDLQRAMLDKKAEPLGTLKVTISTVFGQTMLTPLLPKFSKKYPKILLEIDYSDRNVDLVAEGVDVAIRVGPLKDSSLMATKIGAIKDIICASPAYIKRKGMPKNISDLMKHDAVAYMEDGKEMPWFVKEKGKIKEIVVPGVIRVNYGLAYTDMIKAGLGIGLSQEWLIKEELASGKLIQVLPHEWVGLYLAEKTEVNIVYPKDRFHSQKIQAFVSYLKQEMKL